MRKLKVFLGSVLLLGAVARGATAQVNGGFETGDLTGWTLFGNTGFTGVTPGAPYVHSGGFGAFFGQVGSNGGILQSFSTIAGNTYAFSFWLYGDGGTPNFFDAWWDGASVFSETNAPGSPYTLYTFNVLASTASTEIRFTFRDDPGFWGLDDVNAVSTGVGVAVTPEPATMALLGTGLVGLMGAGRRRRKQS